MGSPKPERRRKRRWIRWLGGSLVVLLGMACGGAVYESVAEAADLRAYPPPGQMVDVGGYRLHINCTGSGSPTVIIEAGLGDWSASWASWVQPEVANTTRVCTFDRAGMGYSEPGPLPRDAEQFALELRTLLQRAGIRGPYVMVGHSMGGLPVRVFAHKYPTEVEGVVLIESMNPKQAKGPVVDATSRTTSPPSGLSILTLPARLGVLRLLTAGSKPALSTQTQGAYTAFSATPRNMQATLDESRGMPASFAEAGAVTSLGDLPLIVLSRGLDPDAAWQAMQTDLLHLSANSQQAFAEKSGHNIEIDQPAAAIEAVEMMVTQVRQINGSR
jgi:pimeloyl-ACP methyl ester carboxylesterase